jgi:hypothetical protein
MTTTTVSICEEIETIINHPAEYIQEKVRRHGISCFFLPHCCTPAWVLSPECYVLEWVKTKDPWTEVVKTLTCSDYQLTIEEAFKKWLVNLVNPIPGLRIITGDLSQLFALYIGAAYEAAEPIPTDCMPELLRYAESGNHRFSIDNVHNARWLKSTHSLASPLWPGGSTIAITFYNLIIISESLLNESFCQRLSIWAHELVHVNQYNLMGWDRFLQEYLTWGLAVKYEDIPVEAIAFDIQAKVLSECLSRPQPLAFIPEGSFSDKYHQIINLISELEVSGDVVVVNGDITQITESGKEELLKLIEIG